MSGKGISPETHLVGCGPAMSEAWQDRIDRAVSRWWRRAAGLHPDITLKDDLRQACWVVVCEGKVREQSWASDLNTAIREQISLDLRGVKRGSSAPWPWGHGDISRVMRARQLPVEDAALIRVGMMRAWQRLRGREKLLVYGICCVAGALGPGSAGIPAGWCAQWGFTKAVLHRLLNNVRHQFREALK